MKHAGAEALKRLGPFLAELRKRDGLKEKSPGTFYRSSRAFLHFHEHEGGFFADVRLKGDAFDRMPASSKAQRESLLDLIDKSLADGNKKARR